MFYKKIYEKATPGSAFSKALGGTNSEKFCVQCQHGAAFVGSMHVLVCPKKTLDTSLHIYYNYCILYFFMDLHNLFLDHFLHLLLDYLSHRMPVTDTGHLLNVGMHLAF